MIVRSIVEDRKVAAAVQKKCEPKKRATIHAIIGGSQMVASVIVAWYGSVVAILTTDACVERRPRCFVHVLSIAAIFVCPHNAIGSC
jgi:hypothetical protein